MSYAEPTNSSNKLEDPQSVFNTDTSGAVGEMPGSDAIASFFLILRTSLKIYHWQTLSYARHIASNDLVAKLDKTLDQFVEIYIAKYGRPEFPARRRAIPLRDFSDSSIESVMTAVIALLYSWNSWLAEPELITIRDQIVADLQQARYLFTLS